VIDWHAVDMEVERKKRDFERRIEEVGREIQGRIERVEERCKKAEEVRRSEWEKLEGRVMTAEENQERRSDEFLRLMTAVGHEHIKIIRALGEDMHNEFEETRAENRAQSDALLKMMDRLPPS
jgi:hypothetical protein